MGTRLRPLAEQAIVITGASSGIGLATARAAAARGARVMLAARDGEALARICDDITRDGGRAEFRVVDVSSEAQVQALAAAAVERFGGFDTWVNNAGVGMAGLLKDIPTRDLRRVFEVNLWGTVHGCLAAARHFRESGAPGAIINVGSVGSDMVIPASGAYAATKFAVKGFTDGLRIDLMQERLPVSVTLVKPSAIDTHFFEHGASTLGAPLMAPPPRYTPSVVADAILFAAEHPRRTVRVGVTAVLAPVLVQTAPGLLDRVMGAAPAEAAADTSQPLPPVSNLHDVPREGSERSGRHRARSFSVTTAAQTRLRTPLAAVAITAAAAAAARGIAQRIPRRRGR